MNTNHNTTDNPCAVCGEIRTEFFKLWFDGYLKLYKCRTCGFVAQYPGPGKDTVVRDYQDLYDLDFLKRGQAFRYPKKERGLQDIANRILKTSSTKNPKILDIGCGDGQFLSICSQRGFDCHGVEDSKALSTYASDKTGAKVVQGQYNAAMFPQSNFDVITLIQVLEHIPTPAEVLDAAHYHLRPNGIIVIEIPSIRAPHFIAYEWTGIKSFVKPPNGVIPSHYGYFTPKVFKTLANNCGFRELSLVTGRWQYKYSGTLGQIGKIIDPVLNITEVGGILYIGARL